MTKNAHPRTPEAQTEIPAERRKTILLSSFSLAPLPQLFLVSRSSLLVPRPLGARSLLLCIIIIIVIIYGPVCFPSAYTITSNFCYLLGQRQQEQQQQRL